MKQKYDYSYEENKTYHWLEERPWVASQKTLDLMSLHDAYPLITQTSLI